MIEETRDGVFTARAVHVIRMMFNDSTSYFESRSRPFSHVMRPDIMRVRGLATLEVSRDSGFESVRTDDYEMSTWCRCL